MSDVRLTRDLSAEGFEHTEIRRLRASGSLHPVRRGAVSVLPRSADAVAEHRRLIEATVPQLAADGVLSHVSAAVLHGLPVRPSDLGRVHLTRSRTGGGGKRRHLLHLHSQPLADCEVTQVDGIVVTSLARTVFDLSRCYPYERAVAAGDRALALGMAPGELLELLAGGRRWAGIGQARRVAAFIDGRAESVGESISRVRIAQAGLPRPDLQLPILLPDGRTAFADFGWAGLDKTGLGTLGEFDGLVKYQQLLRPGESPADAVVREKRREDQLRALGWRVIRWLWSDLAAFDTVADLLRDALDHAPSVLLPAAAPSAVRRTLHTRCG